MYAKLDVSLSATRVIHKVQGENCLLHNQLLRSAVATTVQLDLNLTENRVW